MLCALTLRQSKPHLYLAAVSIVLTNFLVIVYLETKEQFVDLHLHSYLSNGSIFPKNVIKFFWCDLVWEISAENQKETAINILYVTNLH